MLVMQRGRIEPHPSLLPQDAANLGCLLDSLQNLQTPPDAWASKTLVMQALPQDVTTPAIL